MTGSFLPGASKRNPFHAVEDTAPLMIAFELMVKWRVHRIPVVDAEGNLETLITQSHVIKYIHDNIYLLKGLYDKTIEELDLGSTGVFTADVSITLLDAFKIISERVILSLLSLTAFVLSPPPPPPHLDSSSHIFLPPLSLCLCQSQKLSALGIVHNHILVGNLSASDIKTADLGTRLLEHLFTPVGDFVKKIREEDLPKVILPLIWPPSPGNNDHVTFL